MSEQPPRELITTSADATERTGYSRKQKGVYGALLTLKGITAGIALAAALSGCGSKEENQANNNKPAAEASADPGKSDSDFAMKQSPLESEDVDNIDPTESQFGWDDANPDLGYGDYAAGEVEGRKIMVFGLWTGPGEYSGVHYADSSLEDPEDGFVQTDIPPQVQGFESVGELYAADIHDGKLYFQAIGTSRLQVGDLSFQGGNLALGNVQDFEIDIDADELKINLVNGENRLYIQAGAGDAIYVDLDNIAAGPHFTDLDATEGLPVVSGSVCFVPILVNGTDVIVHESHTLDGSPYPLPNSWDDLALDPNLTPLTQVGNLNGSSDHTEMPRVVESPTKKLLFALKRILGKMKIVRHNVKFCGDTECNADETSDTCIEDCPVVDPDPTPEQGQDTAEPSGDIDAGSTDVAEPSGDIDAGSTDTDTYEPDTEPDGGPDTEPDVEPDIEPDTEPDTAPDVEPDIEPDTGPDADPDVSPDTEPDTSPDIDPDTGSDTEPDVEPDTTPDTTIPPECTDNPSHVEAEMPVTSCPIEYDGLQLEFSGEGEAIIYDPNNPDKEPFSIRIERSEHNPGGPFKVICLQYPGYPKADCEADSPGIKVQIVEDGDGYKAEVKGYGVTTGCAASNYMFNNVGERTVVDNGVEKTLTVVEVTSYNEPDEPLVEVWNEGEGWYAQIASDGRTYRINAETGESAIDEPVNPEGDTDVQESETSDEPDVSGGDVETDVDSAETETGGGGGGGCQSCNSTNEKTNPNAIPLVVMTAVLALLYRKSRQKVQETSPRITGETIARKTRNALSRIFSRSLA